MTAGDAIRVLREGKGWSRRDLAIAVTTQRCQLLPPATLARYEMNEDTPPAAVVNVLLTVLMDDDPEGCGRDLALVTLSLFAMEAQLSEREAELLKDGPIQ